MSKNHHRRRGSIGILIISTAVFIFVILPLLSAGIQYNVMLIRHQQCRSILSASMPAVYMAVSESQLSEGRLIYDIEKMSEMVLELVRKNTDQAGFDAALMQLAVEISTVSRPEEASHWLSGARPTGMPLVDATATWRFPDQTEYTVNDRIELVLD